MRYFYLLLPFCRDEAGVQDTFMTYEVYKDDITMRLVSEACKLLGNINHIYALLTACYCYIFDQATANTLYVSEDVKADIVLRQFGEYFFEFCKRSGYDHMLRTLGGTLFEFIENLDALHGFLSLSYKVTLLLYATDALTEN